MSDEQPAPVEPDEPDEEQPTPPPTRLRHFADVVFEIPVGVLASAPLILFMLVKALMAMPASWAAAITSLLTAVVVVVVAAVGIGLLILSADQAARTRRYRIEPGGLPKDAIDHEVAHAEVGNRFRGRTVKGRVFADGSGWVDVRLPRGAPVEHDVAVDMAGARGEGVSFWWSPHAAGDRANAEQRVKHLSWDARRRVYRDAARLATPGFWHRGSAAALRRALTRKGRYR